MKARNPLRATCALCAALSLGTMACRQKPTATVPVVPVKIEAEATRAASAPDISANVEAKDSPPVPIIEISGEIEMPPGSPPSGKLYVYLSRGDCLGESPQTTLLRRMPITDNGTFLLHVLAEASSELSICAALEPRPGQASRLYGRATTPLHIGNATQQEIRDIKVALQVGPPHLFPAPASR